MALSLLAKLDYLKILPWNGATKLAQSNLRVVRNLVLAVVRLPVNYPPLVNLDLGSFGSQESIVFDIL